MRTSKIQLLTLLPGPVRVVPPGSPDLEIRVDRSDVYVEFPEDATSGPGNLGISSWKNNMWDGRRESQHRAARSLHTDSFFIGSN